jgi:hypothetical protein
MEGKCCCDQGSRKENSGCSKVVVLEPPLFVVTIDTFVIDSGV